MKSSSQILKLFSAFALLFALVFSTVERWYLDDDADKTEFCEEEDTEDREGSEESEESDEKEKDDSLHLSSLIANYIPTVKNGDSVSGKTGALHSLAPPAKFYILYHQIKVPEDFC